MPEFACVDSHAHVFDPISFPLRDTGGHMPGVAECGTAQQCPSLWNRKLTCSINDFRGSLII